MVDVGLSDGTVVKATNQHPFWDAGGRRWVYAEDLSTGDSVLTADGALLTIVALRAYDQDVTAYNLTVDNLHTYYAGATPVLVHNTGGACDDALEDGIIYREGGSNPGNLKPRAADNGSVSFRDSLSNPWIPPAQRGANWRPVLRPGRAVYWCRRFSVAQAFRDP